ncbi:MAG TPA: class I SAM-dependent methyltransferase [Steroidobacteraceae bacterium]|nr:class I SAM-dependent methyltransferase [Steroidobacteraceae bacterium]
MLTQRVDLFDSTYGHFTEDVLATIRRETFGEDIGQNSWLTVEEFDRFISWLRLRPDQHVLEIASGSGGPALYLADRASCRVTGIDNNEIGVAEATRAAFRSHQSHRVGFRVADANAPLPFADDTFDALLCIDSMNHFPDRLRVLQEWQRVLRPGGRAVFTDPVVINRPVTNDDLAARSSIGLFVFSPRGVNEDFIDIAGLNLLRWDDVTLNCALVAGRWLRARDRHREALLEIEGAARFEGLQKFFGAVHRLTSERRLTRVVYMVEKQAT